MQRHHKRLLVIAVTVIAIAALLWYTARPAPVAITIASVERARVEATVANTRAGTIETCQRARLAPTQGGQVARLLVKKGVAVEKGQALIELWNDDLAARLQLTESESPAARGDGRPANGRRWMPCQPARRRLPARTGNTRRA